MRCDIEVSNIHRDNQGRVVIFDAVNCTWANIYLPSGNSTPQRHMHEKKSSSIIPQLMSRKLEHGSAGGDLNCIVAAIDCIGEPQRKMSLSLCYLISTFEWSDSCRALHPKVVQFSRIYGNALGEGASRIDCSYHRGVLTSNTAEYIRISFSDHLCQLVSYALPSFISREIAPHSQPAFKISPKVVDISQFQLVDAMQGWQQVRQNENIDLLVWWQYLVKTGIKKLALDRSKELNVAVHRAAKDDTN